MDEIASKKWPRDTEAQVSLISLNNVNDLNHELVGSWSRGQAVGDVEAYTFTTECRNACRMGKPELDCDGAHAFSKNWGKGAPLWWSQAGQTECMTLTREIHPHTECGRRTLNPKAEVIRPQGCRWKSASVIVVRGGESPAHFMEDIGEGTDRSKQFRCTQVT